MVQCLIIIEKAKDNYSAYSPDLPGCIATRKTIEMHIQGLRRDNQPLPEPRSIAEHIQVV